MEFFGHVSDTDPPPSGHAALRLDFLSQSIKSRYNWPVTLNLWKSMTVVSGCCFNQQI